MAREPFKSVADPVPGLFRQTDRAPVPDFLRAYVRRNRWDMCS